MKKPTETEPNQIYLARLQSFMVCTRAINFALLCTRAMVFAPFHPRSSCQIHLQPSNAKLNQFLPCTPLLSENTWTKSIINGLIFNKRKVFIIPVMAVLFTEAAVHQTPLESLIKQHHLDTF